LYRVISRESHFYVYYVGMAMHDGGDTMFLLVWSVGKGGFDPFL